MSTPAYLIGRVDIQDLDAFINYSSRTPRIIEKFGGKFIIRSSVHETLEGEREFLRLVIIEFPSIDSTKAFYASEEYQEAKKIRNGAGSIQFVAVEGYPPESWAADLANCRL